MWVLLITFITWSGEIETEQVYMSNEISCIQGAKDNNYVVYIPDVYKQRKQFHVRSSCINTKLDEFRTEFPVKPSPIEIK